MNSQSTRSENKLVDHDLGWDMAHAEKPYRELGQKAKELGLNDEAQEMVQKAKNTSAEVEEAAQKLGLTVLHSEAEEALQTPVEHMVTANENKAELTEAINQLTAQYGSLFLDRLPPVSQNERNLLGKIKVGKAKTQRWITTKALDGFEVDYDFGLHYRQGQDRNQITGVDILFFNHHDERKYRRQYPPARLRLAMDGSVIKKVQFSRDLYIDKGFQKAIFGDTVLSEFLAANNWPSTLEFDLESDTPGVSIGSRYWEHELRYDPVEAIFTRITKHESSNAPSSQQPYTSEEFKGLLKSTLDLIPTTRL